MQVQIKSLYTGRLNTMDFPVTPGQLARWQEGQAPLVAMPGLNPDHLEFLVSGMTPSERLERFGPLAMRDSAASTTRRQKTRAVAMLLVKSFCRGGEQNLWLLLPEVLQLSRSINA